MGRALAHQQWVQHAVADAQIKLLYLANKIAVEVAQLGVRIGGGSGYLKTSRIQRHLRDAEAGQLMAYSTEVLAGEIGREVLQVSEDQ